MNIAFIALGSNIEPRNTYLTEAIKQIEQNDKIQIEKKSLVYQTDPVGYTDQAAFLNMVIKIATTLSPHELLTFCQEVERKLGRVRKIRWGPRTVDLDILVYNQESVETDNLTIPHPRMFQRAFVLIPLLDVDDSLEIKQKTIQYYIDKLPDEDQEGVTKWVQTNGD